MNRFFTKEKQWIQRFDVAMLLERALDMSYWKGDDHTKGVFFTDEYGYTLNKILAVRIKHDENAPEVFYSFSAENENEAVVTAYPFKDLAIKPKNHHLLFDDLKLKKEDMGQIFDKVPYTYGKVVLEVEPLAQLLEQVGTKRELERSVLSFDIEDSIGSFEIVRKKKKARLVTFKEVINCNRITAEDIIAVQRMSTSAPKVEKKSNAGAVNAHTMLYVLKIFSSFKSVLFLFSHDRIMITGDKQKDKEAHLPAIEVVIALTKKH